MRLRVMSLLLLAGPTAATLLELEENGVYGRRLDDGDNPNCTTAKIANHTGFPDRCSFVRIACAGEGSGNFGSYIELYYCQLGSSAVAFILICVVMVLTLISALGSTADAFFIPQLQHLSDMLQLPPDVAGVTLLALGNGAPDVFTAIAVARQVDFPLLLSDLLGGSVFIATVVLGSVALVARSRAGRRAAIVDPYAFWRDMSFYLICLLSVLFVAADGEIRLPEAIGFLGVYVLYLIVVLLLPRLSKLFKQRRHTNRRSLTTATRPSTDALAALRSSPADRTDPLNSSSDLAAPFSEDPLKPLAAYSDNHDNHDNGDDDDNGDNDEMLLPGLQFEAPEQGSSRLKWMAWRTLYVIELPLSILRHLSIPGGDCKWDSARRTLTALSPLLGGFLFLVMCNTDVPGAVAVTADAAGRVPNWTIVLGASVLASLLLFATTSAATRPAWFSMIVVLGFLMTVVWLNLLANEVVAVIESVGFVAGISTSILGLTVIAIGNSIGDFVADTAAARTADVRMAVGATFGSPLLMNILGVGVSTTLYTAMNNKAILSPISKQCRVAYFFLALALLSSIIAFPLGRYSVSRLFAYWLFLIYAAFIVVSLLVEAGTIPTSFLCSWLPYGHPDECEPPQ